MTKAASAPPQQAAGCLVWRERGGELEVLLVHRPRYRDWSWPKGKLKAGETLAACALRETVEETGRHVVLGRPLPSLSYPLKGGRPKQVHYWAARRATRADESAIGAQGLIERANSDEIDKVVWVSALAALRRLTRASDAKPLRALVHAHMTGTLETTSLVVLRHARAMQRSAWAGDEATRPLTETGRRRADALVPALAAFGVTRIVTSPWQRCLATVAPYAKAAGRAPELLAALSEDGARAASGELPLLVATMLAGTQSGAICTHRPVLPQLLEPLSAACRNGVRKALPMEEPYLATGEALVLQVSRSILPEQRSKREVPRTGIVSAERLRPVL